MFRRIASAARPLLALCLAVFVTLLGAATTQAAEHVRVEANVTETGVEVNASAKVHAPFFVIWQTLTDYDHLAEFIPGMKMSRVIGRSGTAAIVEQAGEAGNCVLSYPIEVVVESDEHPPSMITVRILSGNMRSLEGAYHLEKVAGEDDTFILSWSGTIRPDIDLPGFVEEWALRENIGDQFRGMVAEIKRRTTEHIS
jgi:ribosome-associated toxin RatA of RatAB toxin-antitoxin module